MLLVRVRGSRMLCADEFRACEGRAASDARRRPGGHGAKAEVDIGERVSAAKQNARAVRDASELRAPRGQSAEADESRQPHQSERGSGGDLRMAIAGPGASAWSRDLIANPTSHASLARPGRAERSSGD
eukprot:5449365-Prymnesium_polylepis.1